MTAHNSNAELIVRFGDTRRSPRDTLTHPRARSPSLLCSRGRRSAARDSMVADHTYQGVLGQPVLLRYGISHRVRLVVAFVVLGHASTSGRSHCRPRRAQTCPCLRRLTLAAGAHRSPSAVARNRTRPSPHCPLSTWHDEILHPFGKDLPHSAIIG